VLIAALGIAVVLFLMLAAAGDTPMSVPKASGDTVADATPPAQDAAPAGPVAPAPATSGRSKRQLVTMRGEIVDYYCYIEKGLRGEEHKECGVRCVAGDVCMGLLTDDQRLFMISINHMRAMEPLKFEGIPDPFAKCRGMISKRVEMTGYAMERHWQRVFEVTAVKEIPATG
jgi:hypothetical protein